MKHGGPPTVHDWTVKDPPLPQIITVPWGWITLAQCFQTSFPRHSQVSPVLRSFHNHPHPGGFCPARIKLENDLFLLNPLAGADVPKAKARTFFFIELLIDVALTPYLMTRVITWGAGPRSTAKVDDGADQSQQGPKCLMLRREERASARRRYFPRHASGNRR